MKRASLPANSLQLRASVTLSNCKETGEFFLVRIERKAGSGKLGVQ
jgi:hypothetical protein